MSTKRVAVIGAGCSGLAAIKTCLDEGLSPTCFESSNDIGGLWRYSDDVTSGRGCVTSTTVINTSKEMMAFSDFPPPKAFPNFMPHSLVLRYYRLYADRFDLTRYIKFNCEVLQIRESNSQHMNNDAGSSGHSRPFPREPSVNDPSTTKITNEVDNVNNTGSVSRDHVRHLCQDCGHPRKDFRHLCEDCRHSRSDCCRNDDRRPKFNEAVNNGGVERTLFRSTGPAISAEVGRQNKPFADVNKTGMMGRDSGTISTTDARGNNVFNNDDGNSTSNSNSSSNDNSNNHSNTTICCPCQNKENSSSFLNDNPKRAGNDDNAERRGDVTEDEGEGRNWTVTVRDKVTMTSTTYGFDAVLVCTGHHAQTNVPEIPGQHTFRGRILHSRDLRDVTKLQGSRHVVVGMGNSACDAAVELSHRGKVFLSTRRGTWLLQRLQGSGLPADVAYTNRLVFATAFSLPHQILNSLVAWNLNGKVDHDLYCLRPNHGPIAAHPTVNDELPNRIACGHVTMKTGVDRLDGDDVYFKDGTVEKDIDNVVLATGYRVGFPFLDPSVLLCDHNRPQLYLHVFPTRMTSPSMAVIGCVQPGGALGPVAEMQCRLALKVFLGEVALPAKKVMDRDIELKQRAMADRYVTSPRHTIQVDYIPYMDELAQWIGCKPNLASTLVRDPLLALQCVTGPCTAYQYRLHGPGRWPKAREVIMTQMDRVKYPLATRLIAPCQGRPRGFYWKKLGLLGVLMASLFLLVVLFMA